MSTQTSHVANLTLRELKDRVKAAVGHLDAIEELIPFTALTDDERRSAARFRRGEEAALKSVLDVADHSPSPFAVLADKDGGQDPKTFETDHLRDTLRRASVLDALATDLEELAREVRDTQLALGGKARSVVLAAYEIAKVLAKHDEIIRAKLAPTIDFYASPARLGAKTRAQRRAVLEALAST
jgi:hypothetical protein